MTELKRPRLTTIEDMIREKSYELFNYMYKQKTYDNYKLLRVACECQNYHVASKLCEYIDEEYEMDCLLDTVDWILEEDEFTTLMYFAKYNWFQLIKKLKGKISNEYINLREFQDGKTALFIAVETSNKLAVDALIDIGADSSLGTVYEERRWEELRDEIIEKLPTHYEELSDYEQRLYYDYLGAHYENEMDDGNYEVRNYVTEIENLSDEFFDIYVTDHIVSDITPIMIAFNKKNLELIKILWKDSETVLTKDSNGVDILDYALKSGNPKLIEFVFKKLAPYKHIKSVEELCSICHTVDSNIETVCKHLYCEECLLKWLAIKQNCPMCRKQFYRL